MLAFRAMVAADGQQSVPSSREHTSASTSSTRHSLPEVGEFAQTQFMTTMLIGRGTREIHRHKGLRDQGRHYRMTDFPQLAYLAQTYFHQEYDLETSTAARVIGSYIADEPPDAIRELATEIKTMLDSEMTESQISNLWITTWHASQCRRRNLRASASDLGAAP